MNVMTAEAVGLPFGRPLTRADLAGIPGAGRRYELIDGSLFVTPHGDPLTRADLEAAPDDGHRYELIDGSLIVTPAPGHSHQRSVGRLYLLLVQHLPDELDVVFAPFDVVLAEHSIVQPDLLVAPADSFTEAELAEAPLLAVEVLSPSTRLIDLNLKRSRYEEAGCASYWVIDPHEPSIIAWELRDGTYEVAGQASGEESVTLTKPFPVTITPSRLLD